MYKELSMTPNAIRSRARRKADPVGSNLYHLEYNLRRKAENPDYLEKRRASGRRAAKSRRSRIKSLLVLARDVPCGVCGVCLPSEVMDFDHIFEDKAFNIAHWGRATYRSLEDVLSEVRKCRVVCPNCHRMRHYNERKAADEGRYYWTDGQVADELPRGVDTNNLIVINESRRLAP